VTTDEVSAADSTQPHYMVQGDVAEPGRHDLHAGDTIASVLADDLFHSHGQPVTLVLVRHGPEGKTRQLIPLDANGKLMDEKQDYVLRDGDELIFPQAH
jgi:hypothetical protein